MGLVCLACLRFSFRWYSLQLPTAATADRFSLTLASRIWQVFRQHYCALYKFIYLLTWQSSLLLCLFIFRNTTKWRLASWCCPMSVWLDLTLKHLTVETQTLSAARAQHFLSLSPTRSVFSSELAYLDLISRYCNYFRRKFIHLVIVSWQCIITAYRVVMIRYQDFNFDTILIRYFENIAILMSIFLKMISM